MYPVIKYSAGKLLGWTVINDINSLNWDVCWIYDAVNPENLGRLQSYI